MLKIDKIDLRFMYLLLFYHADSHMYQEYTYLKKKVIKLQK